MPNETDLFIQHPDEAVPSEWLVEHARSAEAERLARLEADQDLLLRVQIEQFAGPAWSELSTALAQYGYPVIGAWVRTGRIFRHCHEKRIRVSKPPEDGFRPQDADELATYTVGLALARFQQRVLATSKWDPSKGASLTTFYIGQCLIQFPTLYTDWRRARADSARLAAALTAAGLKEPTSPDPAAEFELKVVLAELLKKISDPLTREIAILRAEGWSQAEISEALRVSEGVIESRLHRLRRKSR